MRALKVISFFLVAAAIAGLGFFSLYARRQKLLLQTMRPAFAGISVLETVPGGIRARVDLAIDNHSDLAITIRRQQYSVFLNEQRLTDIIRDEPMIIGANGRTITGFVVTIIPKDILKNVSTALLLQQGNPLPGISNMHIKVKGELGMDSKFVLLNNFRFTLDKPVGELLSNAAFPGANIIKGLMTMTSLN